VGGSIAHADGAAELPLCLVALGGAVLVDGPAGPREVLAGDFFVTHFATALETAELVVATTWPPAAPGESSAFEETALRAGDFAQSMVAVVLRRDDAGVVVGAAVAVGAVTDRPTRLPEVEALLVGTSGAEAAADAGALAATLVDPPGSIHASARYLRSLTGALTRRAVERAS
jgi:carbon-monoxide dehydrogenase medium subunit